MLTANNPTDALEHRVHLVIQSRLDAVPLLASMVGAICESAGLCVSDRQLVTLSLVEAANNAIVHAYRSQPGHSVTVEVTLCPEKLIFDIVDTGRSADPARMNADHRAVLDESSSPASLAESGRGLAIMQEVMNSFEYSVRPGSNCLRLVKYLEKKSVRTSEEQSGVRAAPASRSPRKP